METSLVQGTHAMGNVSGKRQKTKKKINDIENILVNMKSSVRANALADLFHVRENVRMI